MKENKYMKEWILAAAALALCLSCQKTGGAGDVVAEDGEVDIVFGNELVIESVKAGAAEGALEGWNGEDLYIYGVKRSGNGLDFSTSGADHQRGLLIDNVKAAAPEIGDAGQKHAIKVTKPGGEYYHYSKTAGDRYDFFAYYKDDAVLSDKQTDETTSTISYTVTIDGTQDIMMAYADPKKDGEAMAKVNSSRSAEEWASYAYSATAGRNKLNPNLIFSHKLSLFDFYVKTGYPDDDEKYELEAITIHDMKITSRLRARMTVVRPNPGENDQCFVPFDEPQEEMSLWWPKNDGNGRRMYVNVPESDKVKPTENEKQLGQIMVMPGDAEYTAILYLKQKGYSYSELYPVPMIIPIEFKNGKKAEPGYRYKATLTVWGLERVDISVTMEPWKQGDGFNLDPDDIESENTSNGTN